MGLIFLQANDGHAAIRSFDVVASQGLPVAFYAEMRGRKQDQAVKCELRCVRSGLSRIGERAAERALAAEEQITRERASTRRAKVDRQPRGESS